MNLPRHPPSTRWRRRARGFTLVEMIMVIVILGIIASMVAVFIAKPVQGYVDSVRRAELTDGADVALRRIMRDVRLALPNSLRVKTSGGYNYIEFIMTNAGGRYRDPTDGSTAGNFLSFTDTTNKTFDVLGTMPANPTINAAGPTPDYIAVYNLGEGYAPADAYVGGNRAAVASVAGNLVTLSSNPFASQSPPLPSPSSRFQVIPGGVKAVTYACPTAAAGNLTRYWNYGFNATQPNTFASGSSAVLASGTATCTVDYAATVMGRNGLLYISLTLTSGGESVTLFHEIHVDNSP